MSEGQKRNRKRSFAEKALQSEIPSKYDEADYELLKCNTDPRKTASLFALQEQMVESRAWKKIRGLIEDDKCRLCGEHRETIQHLLSRCKKLEDQNMSNATTIHSTFWRLSGNGDVDNASRNKVVCGKMGERKSAGKWRKERNRLLGLGAQDENELYWEKAGSYTGG